MHQAKASQEIKEQRDSAEAVSLRRDSAPIERSTLDGTILRSTEDLPVNAKIESYKNYELIASLAAGAQTKILPEDVKCKLAQKDLGLSVTPTINDRILRADGSLWSIVSVASDKHSAWWFLQLRRP